MPILDLSEMAEMAATLMGSGANSLSATEKEAAAQQAVLELGWVFPLADGVLSYWAIERTKRHLLQVLASSAAMKFQYKLIHLEHRFKHLMQMIEKADKDFLVFAEDNMDLFPAAATSYSDFAYYITSGFSYDPVGYEV